MKLFDRFKKNNEEVESLDVADDAIVVPADDKLINAATVSDSVFVQKMMGDSIAFQYLGNKVIICSPANGTLFVFFPTGQPVCGSICLPAHNSRE